MKTINIDYNSKNYQVEVSLQNAFPYGYYKIDYDNDELLKIIPSPVFFECKNNNSLSISHVSNLEQLTLLTSIVSGIFINQIMNSEI
jgi:hypothetical protein